MCILSFSGPHGSLGTAQRPSEGQPPCGLKQQKFIVSQPRHQERVNKSIFFFQKRREKRHGRYRETDGHTDSAVSPARPAQPGCVHVGTDMRGELLAVTAGDELTGRTGRPCSGPAETAGSAAPGGRCDRWTLPFCPLNPGGPWTPARPVIPGKPISPSVPLSPKNPF